MAMDKIAKSAVKMMGGKKMMLNNGRWKEASTVMAEAKAAAEKIKNQRARGKAKERVQSETQVTKDAYKKKAADLKNKAKKDMTKAKVASTVQNVAKGVAMGVVPAKKSSKMGKKVGEMGKNMVEAIKPRPKTMLLKGLRGKKMTPAQRAAILGAIAKKK